MKQDIPGDVGDEASGKTHILTNKIILIQLEKVLKMILNGVMILEFALVLKCLKMFYLTYIQCKY